VASFFIKRNRAGNQEKKRFSTNGAKEFIK
jgi:hypothetical protein